MQRVSILLFLGLGFTNVGVSEGSSFCALPWNLNLNATTRFGPTSVNMTAQCPFGYALPKLDVTVPTNATWIDWVCIFYGIIPFVIIGCASLETIVRAVCQRGLGTRETSFLVFVGFQVLLGEFVFKRIVQQARPDTSCAHTCGMPSSHTTMSIGFFTLLFLDAIHRVMPSFPRDLATAQLYTSFREKVICCGYTSKDLARSLPAMLNFVPITDYHTLSAHSCAVFICVWGVLLLPVGFTRIALNDHTPAQVTIGAIIGFVEAIAFFALSRRCLQKRFQPRIGTRCLFVFIHNYAVPVFEAVGNGWNLLADLDEYDADTVEAEDVEALAAVRREVQYYTTVTKPCLPMLMLDDEMPAVQYQLRLLNTMDAAVLQKLKEFGHDGKLDGVLEEEDE